MNVLSAAPPPFEESGAAEKAPSESDATLSAERPFPGLRPFTFDDRAFFFGRESQAFALYRLVGGGRFIAVVGSSGSGKSSLVLAGLCDLLEQETQDANGPSWIWRVMRPGASPISHLAETLARVSATDETEVDRLRERVEARLRQSSFSLQSAIDEAGGMNGRRLLLVVDQFEELFRFGLAGLGHHGLGLARAKARDEATLFVQILLDARRVPNVHVLITMRSDFIGDCSYFAGLPEAVSGAQYLVPGLTRMQLEEVIRRPIEEAGGSIEPELVERLLNDCSEELDQLPVLQHCLMRMWDLAGDTPIDGRRRLTRQTYDAIGRMSDALSRHADEVLDECAGRQLAVEQAFRALSELDREGRAIRRGRPFGRLLAETGVSESDLRDVLDKFRAPTCSFLVPPIATALKDDDVVDIGHEALLRCWKTLHGDDPAKTSSGAAFSPGWLAEERADGERYHTLLSLLEGEKASLTAPEETQRWWDSRPRTAAWAERYGGKIDAVKKLIDDSIEAKRRSLAEERRARRNKQIAMAFAGVGVLIVIAGFWSMRESERRREIVEQRLREEATDVSAAKSVKSMLEEVLRAYNDKSLDLAGAESLAKISGQFLVDTRAASKTSAADLVWGQALNVEADLQATLNNDKDALDLANSAKRTALSLIEAKPDARQPLQVLYDASIRTGDALSAMGRAHRPEALQEYKAAVETAGKIEASISRTESNGDDVADNDIIDAHVKIGDIYKDNDLFPDSETEYRSSLAACEAALAKRPQSLSLLRNKGKAYFRIADLYRKEGDFDQARTFYAQAADVQQDLVQRNERDSQPAPDKRDLSLTSNLAATYTHWGMLEKKAEKPDLALTKLRLGAALDESLIKAQPANPQWVGNIAPIYSYIAEILTQLSHPKDALDYYQKYFDARRTLAFRGVGPPEARRQFADAAKLLGDHASGMAQIEAYRTVVRIWSRLIDEPKAADAAAAQYDAILEMANLFDARNDWPDAQFAFLVASKMAMLNFAKDTANTAWRDKAESAERASVAAEMAAQTAPQPP